MRRDAPEPDGFVVDDEMTGLAGWYQDCFAQDMAYKSPYDGPLKLELVGDPVPSDDTSANTGNAAPAVAQPASAAWATNTDNAATAVAKPASAGVTNPDRFLIEATREFTEGRIDQPLWARALIQGQGDEASARVAYLRARATALRVLKRDKRLERADRRTRAASAAINSFAIPASQQDVSSSRANEAAYRTARPWLRSRTAVAVTLGSLVVVAVLFVTLRASLSTAEPADAAAAPPAAPSGPDRRAGNAPVASNKAVINAANEDPSPEFMARIQELKTVGNWNVVVLQASAWTRKQPANTTAWKELGIGYANMRQFDDARAALQKAVELAPKDALLWRTLGQLDLDVDEPVEALAAFDEATRWNDKDEFSFVQAGILNARLGRLPEARLAFSNALALNSDNVDARCGVALTAQRQPLPKDAKATGGQVTPSSGGCRDLIERASATVQLKGPTAFKVAPSRGR